MSFGGLILTNEGRNELAKAEMGQTFTISKVILGEGKHNGSFMDIDALVSPVMFLDIKSMTRKDNEICLEVEYSTKNAPKAFYLREIGIIANGKLCYYDNSQDDAEYINPQLDNIIKQKRMRFLLLVSEAANVEATIASGLYAMANDLNEHIDDAIKHVSSEQTIAWDSMLEKSKEYTDAAYQQSTGYTDQKIADLINGAPTTLDTLGEIAKAMAENNDVVTALHEAMGTKANQKEVESWLGTKLDITGDSGSTTANYTSDDTETPSAWKNFARFTGLEKVKEFFTKVSTMASNLRWLHDKYDELNSKFVEATESVPYSGYTVSADSYVRRDKTGRVDLYLGGSQYYVEANTYSTIAFVPEGFRPKNSVGTVAWIMMNNSTGEREICPASIHSNGDIRVRARTTGIFGIGVVCSYMAV